MRAILQEGTHPNNSLLRREVTGTLATLARFEGKPALAWSHINSPP